MVQLELHVAHNIWKTMTKVIAWVGGWVDGWVDEWVGGRVWGGWVGVGRIVGVLCWSLETFSRECAVKSSLACPHIILLYYYYLSLTD